MDGPCRRPEPQRGFDESARKRELTSSSLHWQHVHALLTTLADECDRLGEPTHDAHVTA